MRGIILRETDLRKYYRHCRRGYIVRGIKSCIRSCIGSCIISCIISCIGLVIDLSTGP